MTTEAGEQGPHRSCRARHMVRAGARAAPVRPVGAAGDPAVQALVDAVSAERLADDVAHLASYDTRHSLSPGFASALEWAEHRLRDLGATTSRLPVAVGPGTSHDLVAEFGPSPDTGPVIVIGAHLDSINTAGGPSAPAPGADDNASGVAGVLEAARVLTAGGHRAGLRLILFGGEEEGLFGSEQYVSGLAAEDRARITAMINMDMVGRRNTSAPTVLLEGAELSRPLVEQLATAAGTYTDLLVQTSFHPFASDHVPFIEAGIPAVLTIEGADDTNDDVHTPADIPATVDADFAARIVALATATVAEGLLRNRSTPITPGSTALGPQEASAP